MPEKDQEPPSEDGGRDSSPPTGPSDELNAERRGMLLPRIALGLSLVLAGFCYGYLSHRNQLPPASLISQAKAGFDMLREKLGSALPWYYVPTEASTPTVVYQPEAISPGLTLFASLGKNGGLFAHVVDREGNVVIEWNLDWFRIWPDATHLPTEVVPRSAPGTLIAGMILTEEGDLIFNYDALGMVRVDICGNVIWRLPYRTHHSLIQDEEGVLWAPGQRTVNEPQEKWRLYRPPFEEFTIVRITPDGQLLSEVSVFDILRGNAHLGLLYMASHGGWKAEMTGDTLHLNSVKLFGRDMAAGHFQPGDVMISLRNINAVLVLEPETWKMRYVSIGKYVRQHDPHFLDGNTISIFDNNDLGDREDGVNSRILIEDVPSGVMRVAFRGSRGFRFFSNIMGKHEWLPNGNLLLLESTAGRIWEVDRTGRKVWEFNNLIYEGMKGVISDAMRLPPEFTPERLMELRALCEAKSAGRSLAGAQGATSAKGKN